MSLESKMSEEEYASRLITLFDEGAKSKEEAEKVSFIKNTMISHIASKREFTPDDIKKELDELIEEVIDIEYMETRIITPRVELLVPDIDVNNILLYLRSNIQGFSTTVNIARDNLDLWKNPIKHSALLKNIRTGSQIIVLYDGNIVVDSFKNSTEVKGKYKKYLKLLTTNFDDDVVHAKKLINNSAVSNGLDKYYFIPKNKDGQWILNVPKLDKLSDFVDYIPLDYFIRTILS